jgi:hypothetical protein
MSVIQISSPFHKKFVHADYTVGLTASNEIGPVNPGEKRVSTIIQNKSSTATVTLILNDSGSTGFVLQPSTFFSIDNYNGTIRLAASAANTTVHIGYSLV